MRDFANIQYSNKILWKVEEDHCGKASDTMVMVFENYRGGNYKTLKLLFEWDGTMQVYV